MSESNGWTLIIVPRFTSLLSVLGSSMIISQVLRSERNRGNTQQRLVCAMSIIDVTVSTAWFLTPLFVTKDMQQFKWAIGNDFSCSLQGFIVQASIAGVLYNACLSVYYLLVIKYGFQQYSLVIVERCMHAFALIFGLSTATIAVVLGLIEDANWDCWISPQNKIYQWAFFFAPLWICIIFVTIIMYTIFLHVRKEERCSFRMSNISGRSIQLRKTKAVAKQAILYVGAFFVTWLFPTVARLIKLISGEDPPNWLVELSGAFIPVQGFFNALVYFRFRFITCQRENPERSSLWAVSTIVRRSLCCCINRREDEDMDGLDLEPASSSQQSSSISAEPDEPCTQKFCLPNTDQGTRNHFLGKDEKGMRDMSPAATRTLAEVSDKSLEVDDSLSSENVDDRGVRLDNTAVILSDEEAQALNIKSERTRINSHF